MRGAQRKTFLAILAFKPSNVSAIKSSAKKTGPDDLRTKLLAGTTDWAIWKHDLLEMQILGRGDDSRSGKPIPGRSYVGQF